jgi:hypothetical protein
MFIAALLTIAKIWKQPRCTITNKWIKKLWYLYTMEFYSFASKWMELKNIILAKLARLRRPKITCSPSYVDYRLKTNAVILLDMGHTLKGEHIQEEQGKGRKRKT